ncbi:MAG TPA: CopD family protein [Candidatus Bathyarchaeia archaeon]|nr:CopD family protein [Candidatus Bathyarchaeia archaeon]
MLNHKKIPKYNCLIVVLFTIASAIIATGLPVGLSISHYAYAHSLPMTEIPAANSVVPKGAPLPPKIIVDFSERPSPTVSSLTVINSKNEVVNNGDFKVIGDGGRLAMTTLDTKKLTDGLYTVQWETQSLDDGHIAKGSYVFGIGNIMPGAVASAVKQASAVQSVTSPLDGLVKWPVIVAQVAVVGGIFSHLFLWENFGSKIGGGRRVVGYGFAYDKTNTLWLRRFSILIIASSVAILAASSAYLFLQIIEISPHNSSIWSIFMSQISGASGTQWIMRSITSLIVIAFAVSYYYVVKTNMPKMTTDSAKVKTNKTNLATSLLYAALITGSISIFSNSITSHNAGVHFLPSLSISLDWLHFMAVSIWIGGLFYISTVLLSIIRSRAATHADNMTKTGSSTDNPSNTDKSRSILLYYLALLLPRFSILATISLGVIGVSGLYMAWTQLQSFNSLFSSSYGNILIIKLSIAVPLVLLGAYHQLRLHKNAVLIASIGKAGRSGTGGAGVDSSSQTPISQTLHNNNDEINNNNNNFAKNKVKVKDIPSKFSKTIKIECLFAMGVLLAASILTISEPPVMNMSSMAMTSSNSNTMPGMSMKNSTYTVQTKVMNVNTKIEINPFYSGFNTFKVTFTDAAGKPYTKVTSAEIVFNNAAADITNEVANLQKIGPGVFSVTGGYISQPGEWDMALSAQRVQDLDLYYEFTHTVTNAPSASQSTVAVNQAATMQEAPPHFDSFAWLAIVLAAAVVFGSVFYYRRSKQELRKTVEMLKLD